MQTSQGIVLLFLPKALRGSQAPKLSSPGTQPLLAPGPPGISAKPEERLVLRAFPLVSLPLPLPLLPTLPSLCQFRLTSGAERGRLSSGQVSPLPGAVSARGTLESQHAVVSGVHYLLPVARGWQGGKMGKCFGLRSHGGKGGASRSKL